MENIPFSKTETGLSIDGYPDATGLIPLEDRSAKRLAHLALHRQDLGFALECLHGVNLVKADDYVLRQSLWRCAVLHYFKCFGKSKSRFQLQSAAVYRTEPKIALEVFKYLKPLRDKHFVHDENSFLQCMPVAVLNGGDKAYKIEKIVCISMLSETLTQEGYSNLEMLIHKAIEWVTTEFDDLAEEITRDLDRENFEELSRRVSNVSQNVPSADDMHLNRSQ